MSYGDSRYKAALLIEVLITLIAMAFNFQLGLGFAVGFLVMRLIKAI